MMKLLKNWSNGELSWLLIAVAIVAISSNGDKVDFATAVTGVVYVILLAKGRKSAFFWGFVAGILYALARYEAGFFGSTVLWVLYFIPMRVVGWFLWRNHTENKPVAVTVRRLDDRSIVILDVVILFTTATVALLLSQWSNNPHPIPDAFLAVTAVVGIWLAVNRYAEQWILWIAVNITNIYVWAMVPGDNYVMIAMHSVFLVNSLYGAYLWLYVSSVKRE